MSRRVTTTRALVCALVLLTAGCNADGLAFRNDNLVTVTTPTEDASVGLPLEVTFDVAAEADATGYAVFLDRTPQRVGAELPEDRFNIIVTDEPRVVFTEVPITGSGPAVDRDRHEVTVILVDADGRRVGETFDFVEFRIER